MSFNTNRKKRPSRAAGARNTLAATLGRVRSQSNASHMGENNGGINIRVARKMAIQDDFEVGEQGRALVHCIDIHKEGFLNVRTSSFISRTGNQRLVELVKGQMKIFRINKETHQPDTKPDRTINLVDVRDIKYKNRGDKEFALIIGSAQTRTRSGTFSAIGRLAAPRKSNYSHYDDDTTVEPAHMDNTHVREYRQKKIIFHGETSADIEDWIQHILEELKNKAMILDKAMDAALRKAKELSDYNYLVKAEAGLRQAVDLWTLAAGRLNDETADAQERLAKCLRSQGDEKEAEEWTSQAAEIRKEVEMRREIVRTWGDQNGEDMHLEDAMEDLKQNNSALLQGHATRFEELQEQTALFGIMAESKRNLNMTRLNDIDKWRLLDRDRDFDDERYI